MVKMVIGVTGRRAGAGSEGETTGTNGLKIITLAH